MKKKTIIPLVLSFITLSTLSIASDEPVVLKGFRLNTNLVEKDFTMMSESPTRNDIMNYIKKTNPRITYETSEAIAENVIKVSECFKIDPWILTGLIKKESTFNPKAISPTNAVGLTQFTSAGINEVNDQLGLNGTAYASTDSIEYFNNKIKTCIDPTWKHAWDRVAVQKDDPEFISEVKTLIMSDIELAVTYGGILLKTYLVVVDGKHDMRTSEMYFRALQIYNGEPGNAKVEYARAIFKNLKEMYPKKVNFNF